MDQSKNKTKDVESKRPAEETSHRRTSSNITDDDGNASQSSNSPPLPPASAAMTPAAAAPQSPSLYMSPVSSSSSKSPMLTIDAVGDKKRIAKSQSAPSFVAYDSDASGSSFVQQKQQQAESSRSTYGKNSSRHRRDRFPSFDSHTSQGSIRYVSPRSQPRPSMQPSNPSLLPYHERKKLQQQQQQQQNQKQPPPNPPQFPQGPFPPMLMMPPPPPLPGQMPYGNAMDPQAAAAAFYSIYGFPPPHQVPGFPPPPQQQQQNQSQQQQNQQQPSQNLPGFPPGFMMPPPPIMPFLPGGQPPNQQQQRGGGGGVAPIGPFLQPYPMPFYPPPNLPQLFPQHQNQPHPNAQQRRSSQNSNSSRDGLPRNGPKPRPQHVRADSYGSMSSLGSAGGGSDSERSTHRRNSGSSGSGFFVDMFNNNKNPFAAAPFAAAAPVASSPFSRPSPRGTPTLTDSPRHRRVGSQDRPPASRGTHKRLASISNDEWGDASSTEDRDTIDGAGIKYASNTIVDENSSYSGYSSSEATSDDGETNERASLLPPSGISTNEQEGNDSRNKLASEGSTDRRSGRRVSESDALRSARGSDINFDKRERRSRKKKKKSRRKSGKRGDSDSDASDSSYDYRRWTMKRARMLEKEREQVHQQWKAEYFAETERTRLEREEQRWHRRFFRWFGTLGAKIWRFITTIEMFISNLPAAIGAVAMSVATLGVVWFKFTEETLETCERVHFHSSQCTFPEFPGCFYCDTTVPLYQVALKFHYGCNVVAGILAFMFVAKILLATRVVIDEMASPVTASPAGLLCMTTVCVFAGRGLIGQIMVSLAASVHLGLVIWYIYMALAYQIMPEPTWFPNTVGIGLTAVKTWLYYPMPGHLLMAISISLNIFFFPISLIRVAINEKISATVGWMQMSAPAVSLYALTIMAQPSFEEENPDVTNFQRVHRMIYLPCMHFMCALSLIGFFASVHSLWSRWDDLKKRPFSPAHSAFCFPTLSHANAIQSYRGAVLTFSEVKPHDWRLLILYAYWFVVLLGGTIATFWISSKFMYNLPVWTNLDLADEEEPPAPSETILSLQEMITAGETMRQPFVSPAVLQANETGALVATRTGPEGRLKYVRTRRLPALGFEPTMKWSEMQKEREVLLEWVGKNPPRRRHRTLSVPGIDFSYGSSSSAFGMGNRSIYGGYGSFSPLPAARSRADTGGAYGW